MHPPLSGPSHVTIVLRAATATIFAGKKRNLAFLLQVSVRSVLGRWPAECSSRSLAVQACLFSESVQRAVSIGTLREYVYFDGRVVSDNEPTFRGRFRS